MRRRRRGCRRRVRGRACRFRLGWRILLCRDSGILALWPRLRRSTLRSCWAPLRCGQFSLLMLVVSCRAATYCLNNAWSPDVTFVLLYPCWEFWQDIVSDMPLPSSVEAFLGRACQLDVRPVGICRVCPPCITSLYDRWIWEIDRN